MRPNLAATETGRLGIDPLHQRFEALAILLLRDGPWARLFCFGGMVAVSKSGGIPWEGEQAFWSDLALHVGLDGDGGEDAHTFPLVVEQGLLAVVVGLAHGGELVGCETAEVVVCEVDDGEGEGKRADDGQRLFFCSSSESGIGAAASC